jgi:hypothetical protein
MKNKIKLKIIKGAEYLSDKDFVILDLLQAKDVAIIVNTWQRWGFKSFRQTNRSLFILYDVSVELPIKIVEIELRSMSVNIPELIYNGHEKDQIYFKLKN